MNAPMVSANDEPVSSERAGPVAAWCARFEVEVMPLVDHLRAVAWKYAGNASDAEDLLQETLLRAFKAFARFDQHRPCMPWLLTIMRNTWITNYRASRHRPVEHLVADYSEHEASASTGTVGQRLSAEDQVLCGDVNAELLRAVLALSLDMRKTLYLVAFQDLDYHEVARLMGVSRHTVASRMHRIRRSLRMVLQQHEICSAA